ncbi:hypothetical protein MSUIS_06940 [Mycoplasma suis KI3806]|uniref:Uncharacterized protein n=1 Tax=Mycoplasma suis (strain KI_3806) TaxID=708248 RepID=F0V2A6_MYCS3|nr:hypothetical protein [Mycoplasma suis]CBZ40787.1 hypothetical protein MSUIS_06940 [Mycoplasma suis KI3806]
MRHHRGGGALVSVVGSEYINSGQISTKIQSAFETFVGWFKPTNTEPSPQQEETQSNGNFLENLSEKFQTVKGWFTTIFQSIKKIIEAEKKFFSKFLESSGQQQVQREPSSSNDLKIDWRDFFSGLWILWGFAYRDIFRIEFGSFFYL